MGDVKLTNQDQQLVDQARQHVARTYTERGWMAEQSLDHPGYWDVYTMDTSGTRRIILARFVTSNTAALMCFVSTGLVKLCDLAEGRTALHQAPTPRTEDGSRG